MSSIVSIASIARHAQAAARRGQPREANPYPPLDPAHAVWADCHAAATPCAGCDQTELACAACGQPHAMGDGFGGEHGCAAFGGLGLAAVVRRIAREQHHA